MTDIVKRLREYASDDHERGCQGRYYDCTCGYDDKRDPLLDEAATRIAQLEEEGDKARARGDRMRMALEDIAYPNPLHNEDDLMRIARTILEVNNV
jgi:hypothetical protein